MKACVNNNVKGRWFFKKETSETPFGMTMPGRSYNAHTYRHGFTGHEKESDLSEGIYTTEYRLYDARVGRWLSVDPLFEKYVGMSPYNYCMLNPVMLVDLDGRAPRAYETFNKLHKKEQQFILNNPILSCKIQQNANSANEITKANFGYNGKGDESDAFRHAYWNAINAQVIGEEKTQSFGDAHEYSTPIGEIETDLIMDIHNNDVGIEIGKNYPNATPEELTEIIKEKILSGELIIIQDDQLKKSNGDIINENGIRRLQEAKKIGSHILVEGLKQIHKNNEN